MPTMSGRGLEDFDIGRKVEFAVELTFHAILFGFATHQLHKFRLASKMQQLDAKALHGRKTMRLMMWFFAFMLLKYIRLVELPATYYLGNIGISIGGAMLYIVGANITLSTALVSARARNLSLSQVRHCWRGLAIARIFTCVSFSPCPLSRRLYYAVNEQNLASVQPSC